MKMQACFGGKEMKKIVAIFLMILSIGILAGCGCGRKEPEETATKVIKISITPIPSPTPEPEKQNPDAVVKKGNLTMVNGYTINKEESDEISE